jgi:hypothetical protein
LRLEEREEAVVERRRRRARNEREVDHGGYGWPAFFMDVNLDMDVDMGKKKSMLDNLRMGHG